MVSPSRTAAAAALALALGACSMAPRYQRPAAPVAPAFPAAPAGAEGAVADPGWSAVLGDARLKALTALALERNRDLRMAALNVELTQAQFRIQRAQRLPAIGASGTWTRGHTPADLSITRAASTSSAWSAGVGLAAFELDLFGRVKSLSDAALEQYLATEEARRSFRLALTAAVAGQDLACRALAEQVALARETLATTDELLRLTRRSAEAGRVSELDLRTAEAQVETARFNLASAEQARARADGALVLLAGGPLPEGLPAASPIDLPRLVVEPPPGVPSEVLARRPDVLAAEHGLKSANAVIGAARAAFFPSISLTAFGGTSSASLDGLFQGGSQTWSFTPVIRLPLFQGGALKASLDVAEVRTAIEVARYEKTVQVAFREVADALSDRAWVEAQLGAQSARVAAEQRRYELAEKRWKGGVDSYLTLLTAQRDLFAARQVLIQVRLSRLTGLLDLYKAMGGAWTAEAAAAAEAGAGTR